MCVFTEAPVVVTLVTLTVEAVEVFSCAIQDGATVNVFPKFTVNGFAGTPVEPIVTFIEAGVPTTVGDVPHPWIQYGALAGPELTRTGVALKLTPEATINAPSFVIRTGPFVPLPS
jgi:hypothetical protein